MPTPLTPFDSFRPAAPTEDHLVSSYGAFISELDAPGSDPAAVARHWNQLRADVSSWATSVHIRRVQDTGDEEHRRAQDLADQLRARTEELDCKIKERLLASDERPRLEALYGAQTLALWSADCAAFHPAIRQDLVTEKQVGHRYVDLLAEAEVEFAGDRLALPALRRPCSDPDRDVREEATRALWGWFADHREELDAIFGELVALRDAMAKKAGYADFVELGYLRMQRVDYDREDVERFREQVRDVVVPLVSELRAAQARRLGVEPLMVWDEPVHEPGGSPTPNGGIDALPEHGLRAFADLRPELGEFFGLLVDGGYLDLESRPAKAGGGFCAYMDALKAPFVFSHGAGTWGDVRTLVHEIGHAFQAFSCREMDLSEQRHATYESCEIHSMSLEYLSWPQLGAFFGDGAARVQRIHLAEGLAFLPYGVAVDHFQHLVYEQPSASPAERHAMWQQMERTYLPWRQWGGMPHAADGGRWQYQRHIYLRPFYYIDYTLALTCALQLWARSLEDHDEAMADWLKLCRLGGTLPFQQLVGAVGLVSPFQPGCLDRVVDRARRWLQEG